MSASHTEGSHIVLAMDESNHAVRALKFILTNLVHTAEDTITTLVVIQSEAERESTVSRTKTLVSAIYDSFPNACKFSIKTIVASSASQIGPKICEFVETCTPDMLVLGSAGKSHLEGMMVGSVSNYAISHANCPVLVARLTTADESRLERRGKKVPTKTEPFWLS
ncbi:hypothetical protein HDU78_008838 [Chytriomyces hyalinus]|nr:hypothetical protein HDU78_008838 [Chytriomyces hyalinus]